MYISNYCRWRSQFFNQGGGTSKWELIRDRFICGSGSKSVGSTGGSDSITLTVANIPAHTHDRGTMEITGFFGATIPDYHSNIAEGAFTGSSRPAGYNGASYNMGNSTPSAPIYGYDLRASHAWTGVTSSVGNGEAIDTTPPYIIVNIWKRIS